MSRLWRQKARAAALGLALCAGTPAAWAADFRRHDGIHRVEKAHVTEVTVARDETHDGSDDVLRRLRRRDVTTACPASYAACPVSLGGDCCPDGYACAAASCYATTAAAQTCPGKPGYWVCGADVGGGCCPYGLVCGRGDQCTPPAGQPYSQSCPASYYLCPSSLGYGCCETGLACAASQCYGTAPSTLVYTTTITTTPPGGGGAPVTNTVVQTTTYTPTVPTALPTDPSEGVTKFFPSYVPKVQPVVSQVPDAGSGGLTTGQIVGIVAGSAGFLIVVLVTAYIIIRHLNRVVHAVETSQKSSSGPTKSRGGGGGGGGSGAASGAGGVPTTAAMRQFLSRPSASDGDATSGDPLMTSPRPSVHRRGDSDDSAVGGGLESPRWSNGPRGTPGSGRARYRSVPTTNSSELGDGEGYFDVAPAATATRGRRSGSGSGSGGVGAGTEGVASPGRSTRHDSAEMPASPLSHHRRRSSQGEGGGADDVVGAAMLGPHELDVTPWVPELPASPTVVGSPWSDRRRSSGGGGGGGAGWVSPMSRMGSMHARRQSGGGNGGASGRDRSDSAATAAVGPLEMVSESAEIHGYYGPADRSVGQTAAGLSRRSTGGSGT